MELTLFNSLTRRAEPFTPVHEGEARVYTCGPTVYNYPHIGNMRAYVFADVLGRTLSYKGYKLTHVINITDVGHLTDDADDGEDKMERMAAAQKQSIWDIAEHYKQAYWADVRALNIRQPAQWTVATDYVPQMIAFAEGIAAKHCYELDSGLYFDVSTVADYGRLARAQTDDGEAPHRSGGRQAQRRRFRDLAQDPAGREAPDGMGFAVGQGCARLAPRMLGDVGRGAGLSLRHPHWRDRPPRRFDHPNEIAQNQAHCRTNGLDDAANSGAKVWMHNNFLVERSGKMSKSSGEFLRLQLLIDKGVITRWRTGCSASRRTHRSELEFSWEGLGAALTRLKRLVMAVERLKNAAKDSAKSDGGTTWTEKWLKPSIWQLQTTVNTSTALVTAEQLIDHKKIPAADRIRALEDFDFVLGLDLLNLTAPISASAPSLPRSPKPKSKPRSPPARKPARQRISPARRAARTSSRQRVSR
jgi:cysteinyl-tRNA synthetase